MRVFVAGASGAIGRHIVPLLRIAHHEVWGTTRFPDRAAALAEAGARPVVVDAYDADALRVAVAESRPDVIIHQLTDLAGGFGPDDLARTARLREIGTANFIAAATAAGVHRLIAQSGAWLYRGQPPYDERTPLPTPTGAPADIVLHGVITLERLVLETVGLDGIVLRNGYFYGPGTAWPGLGPATLPAQPRVHVHDAARAAVLAVDRVAPGIYNIVDDGAVVSNAKARTALRWSPGERQAEGIAGTPDPAAIVGAASTRCSLSSPLVGWVVVSRRENLR